jgi:hypothetical protein
MVNLRSMLLPLVTGIAVLSVGLVACTTDDDVVTDVVAVPADAPTIVAALERARPGSTIEVSPGTYRESVVVDVAGITIRGTDRNEVIIDGEFRLANGFQVRANDVAIENLTVRNFTQNGIVFNGIAASAPDGRVDASADYGSGDNVLDGYRVSWVTTHNNGLYGVYAFAARNGLIEHSYASGHPDSGFYVGQCQPCDVNLVEVTAELNAIGYYGTNASGGVVVASSVFRGNRLGIAPNSDQAERLAPQAEAIIVGNLVEDNDNLDAPPIPEGYVGGGIAVGGGTRNTIVRNRVRGHDRAGIELLDRKGFFPEGNRVEDNVLDGNAIDLLYGVSVADALGNCFAGNSYLRSLPERIEETLPCSGDAGEFAVAVFSPLPVSGTVDYRKVPPPAPQPVMPDDARRPRAGAGAHPALDIASIGVPG